MINVQKNKEMKSKDVNKFCIAILESLPNEEEKTGYNLHVKINDNELLQEQSLVSEYYDVENKKDFLELLNDLTIDAIKNNHFYILHFEIHGLDGGVRLKNKEDVSWDEMLPIFQKLNFHYRNNLAIYLVVCKGATLIKSINPEERAPFKILISSEKDLFHRDFIFGFEVFYKNFISSLDPYESLEKYNSVIALPENRLVIVDSEYCFDMICDIERDTADKESLVRNYKIKLYNRFPDVKYFPSDYTNFYIENQLKNIFNELKSKKDYFLMKDFK